MKLLLDENLSRRLVPDLQSHFPGTSQVSLLGLERASDRALCDFAQREGFVLVSKDIDFLRLLPERGYQPRLVHLALGNVSNDLALAALLASADRVRAALSDGVTGVVSIEAPPPPNPSP